MPLSSRCTCVVFMGCVMIGPVLARRRRRAGYWIPVIFWETDALASWQKASSEMETETDIVWGDFSFVRSWWRGGGGENISTIVDTYS